MFFFFQISTNNTKKVICLKSKTSHYCQSLLQTGSIPPKTEVPLSWTISRISTFASLKLTSSTACYSSSWNAIAQSNSWNGRNKTGLAAWSFWWISRTWKFKVKYFVKREMFNWNGHLISLLWKIICCLHKFQTQTWQLTKYIRYWN